MQVTILFGKIIWNGVLAIWHEKKVTSITEFDQKFMNLNYLKSRNKQSIAQILSQYRQIREKNIDHREPNIDSFLNNSLLNRLLIPGISKEIVLK